MFASHVNSSPLAGRHQSPPEGTLLPKETERRRTGNKLVHGEETAVKARGLGKHEIEVLSVFD